MRKAAVKPRPRITADGTRQTMQLIIEQDANRQAFIARNASAFLTPAQIGGLNGYYDMTNQQLELLTQKLRK
jgi:hypothetical protein